MLNGIDSIEGLTEEQITAINSAASGMNSKNVELLEKLNSNKTGADASNAEIEALKQFKTNSEIKAAEDAANWAEATKLRDEANRVEVEKLTLENTSYKESERKNLIDNGLSNALDGVNIDKNLKQGALAMLQGLAEIKDGQAVVGDKSLSDYVKSWSESDQGKSYCLAPNNSGGNATGGTASASASNDSPEQAKLSRISERLASAGIQSKK